MLFNEPKLLKFGRVISKRVLPQRVSVLFNEPKLLKSEATAEFWWEMENVFQCSSTSRNC